MNNYYIKEYHLKYAKKKYNGFWRRTYLCTIKSFLTKRYAILYLIKLVKGSKSMRLFCTNKFNLLFYSKSIKLALTGKTIVWKLNWELYVNQQSVHWIKKLGGILGVGWFVMHQEIKNYYQFIKVKLYVCSCIHRFVCHFLNTHVPGNL